MTDQTPTMTAAEASAKIAELKGNPEFIDKYLAGSGPQVAELHGLIKAAQSATDQLVDDVIAGKPDTSGAIFLDPQRRDAVQTLETLRNMGIHEEGVARSVLSGQPVSAQERTEAQAAKDRLMKDADWTKKYLAGDGEARRQMGLLNVILTRGVKETAAS